ncbi:MAG: hypothetical protein WCA21_15345 [Terracidiphilus sp.]|jgi:hypothetical protein
MDTNIEIKQVNPMDEEVLEEWVRVTDDKHILGVCATRIKNSNWPWHVGIYVAEYIRAEPLQSELQLAITNALNAIPGVTGARQEDREVWVVQGNVSGRSLILASAIALDRLADATRSAYENLHKSITPK